MKIIIKEIIQRTSYSNGSQLYGRDEDYTYDISLTGSTSKRDKKYFVEYLSKDDIARKVSGKNNTSIDYIKENYGELIQKTFSQNLDKFIMANISCALYTRHCSSQNIHNKWFQKQYTDADNNVVKHIISLKQNEKILLKHKQLFSEVYTNEDKDWAKRRKEEYISNGWDGGRYLDKILNSNSQQAIYDINKRLMELKCVDLIFIDINGKEWNTKVKLFKIKSNNKTYERKF